MYIVQYLKCDKTLRERNTKTQNMPFAILSNLNSNAQKFKIPMQKQLRIKIINSFCFINCNLIV